MNLPRVPNYDDTNRGVWSPFVYGPERRQGAVVVCPDCGGGMSVGGGNVFGSSHAIAGDGTVTPSVVCPYAGCSWHVFVRLEGWR